MFDRFAHGRRRDWKRRALLIGSLGAARAVWSSALLVGSWFRVDELTPPLLAVVFVAGARSRRSSRPRRAEAPAPTRRPCAPARRRGRRSAGAAPTPGRSPSPATRQPRCAPGRPARRDRPVPPTRARRRAAAAAASPRRPRGRATCRRTRSTRSGSPAPCRTCRPAVIGARRGLGDSTFTARLVRRPERRDLVGDRARRHPRRRRRHRLDATRAGATSRSRSRSASSRSSCTTYNKSPLPSALDGLQELVGLARGLAHRLDAVEQIVELPRQLGRRAHRDDLIGEQPERVLDELELPARRRQVAANLGVLLLALLQHRDVLLRQRAPVLVAFAPCRGSADSGADRARSRRRRPSRGTPDSARR